jgi:hypothetical protein
VALIACLTVGSLGGCSYSAPETRAAYEPVTDATATAKPLALLPAESGAVVSVLESRVAGIFTQRIVLSGDAPTEGENAVTVQIDQTERHPADLGAIPKPTQDSIVSELDSRFPSIDMRISNAWGHNDFGPFGYAVGKAPGGVTCIYAWQYALGPTFRPLADTQAAAAAVSMPSAPTSVRVRLCRQGLSESELVSLVRAMEVYPLGGGAPFHDTLYAGVGPLGAGDALQAAGAPGEFFLRPVAPASSTKSHRGSRAAHRHIAHHRATRFRDAPQTMAPVSRVVGSVVVPLPPGPAAPMAGAVNPLLAPLQQAAPQPRSVATTDEMPLPGAATANSSAPASPRQTSTIPLPN